MTPHQQVSRWNAKVGCGDGVIVKLDDRTFTTTTRSLAQVLYDGRAVVWVDAHTGAVGLECVTPTGRKAAEMPPLRTRIKQERRKRKQFLKPRVTQ